MDPERQKQLEAAKKAGEKMKDPALEKSAERRLNDKTVRKNE